MTRAILLLFCFAALAPMAELHCDSFALSHAAVENDPSLTQRPSAKLWPHISVAEARRQFESKGVLFVDGRSALEWEQSHIPGAVLLSAADFDNSYPTLKHRLIHAKVLICYCHGYSCGIADYVAQMLAAKGLRNMAVFSGGFPAWKRAGYPMVDRNGAKVSTQAGKP